MQTATATVSDTRYRPSAFKNERWGTMTETQRAAVEAELERMEGEVGGPLYVACDFWNGGSVQTEDGRVVTFDATVYPATAEHLEMAHPSDDDDAQTDAQTYDVTYAVTEGATDADLEVLAAASYRRATVAEAQAVCRQTRAIAAMTDDSGACVYRVDVDGEVT